MSVVIVGGVKTSHNLKLLLIGSFLMLKRCEKGQKWNAVPFLSHTEEQYSNADEEGACLQILVLPFI